MVQLVVDNQRRMLFSACNLSTLALPTWNAFHVDYIIPSDNNGYVYYAID